MVRAPCCDKMGLNRGPWTAEEDEILISHVEKHGHGNWRALPKQSGLLRCGKSCRLRWMNYLRPDIRRGNFTRDEEETIISLHQMMGNRWSAMAAKLPGRTDNEIKNVWHTHLKKRILNNNHSKSNESKMIKSTFSRCQEFNQNANSPSYSSSTAAAVSPQQSYSDINNQEGGGMDSFEIDESFWSEDLSPSTSVNENNRWEPRSLDSNLLALDENSCIANNTDDQTHQLQVHPSDKIEPAFDHDMHYWYTLFIGSGGIAELPEFRNYNS